MRRLHSFLLGSLLGLGAQGQPATNEITKSKLPLSFESRPGAAGAPGAFISRGAGFTVLLGGAENVLTVRKSEGPAPSAAVLRMRMLGASATSPSEALDRLPGHANYYLGRDPKLWRTGVPLYQRVRYRDLYPGIDVEYYGTKGELEYDFVVRPGGKPQAVRIGFENAETVTVDADGALVIETEEGTVRWKRPVSYQVINGVRREVASAYRLEPGHSVRFETGAYDPAHPLVIDPVLLFSTLFGGTNTDSAQSLAVDGAGKSYIAGYTFSSDFPKTTGPSYQGQWDLTVVKVNETGTAIEYATYFGGSGNDYGRSIAIDGTGAAYVAGETDSLDLPTVNAFQSTYGGGTDALIVKLTPTGTVAYATYLGGIGFDDARGIAVDGSLNAYVAGETNSANFPTMNAIQPALAGSSDAWVAKLAPNGNALVYSTFHGGSNFDRVAGPRGIAIDGSGSAYVVGRTDSPNFPVVNAAQPAYGTNSDAFVTRFSPDGSAILYSTYLGGRGYDEARSVAVGIGAYVVGRTESFDFPVTAGAVQPLWGGASDAFAARLNVAGNALTYSTFLGGRSYDEASSVSVDPGTGEATVVGQAFSSNFPVSANALQGTKRNAPSLILSSKDSGVTWTATDDGFFNNTNSVRVLTIDPFNGQRIYTSPNNNQMWRTATGGNWGNAQTLGSTVNWAEIARSNTQVIYAATAGSGVYKSTNGGGTYTQIGSGLTDQTVRMVAVDPTNDQVAWAATANGLFRTEDATNWTRLTSIPNSNVNTIAIHPTTPNTVFVGTSSALYTSTDAGGTWTQLSAGLGNVSIAAVVISRSSPSTMYLVSNGAVYRSTTGGQVWTLASTGLMSSVTNMVGALAIHPTNPLIVYAAMQQSGVYRTTNGGSTWSLASPAIWDADVYVVTVDPSNPENIYIGADLERDAIVTRLNADGTSFVYSTFLGGIGYEAAFDVVAAGADALVVGETSTPTFPLTSSAIRHLVRGNDGFLVRIGGTTPACTYSVWSDQAFFFGGVNWGYLQVITPSGCAWTVTSSDPSWLKVFAPVAGTGPSVVLFRTDSNNTGQVRMADLTVQGNTVTFTQAAGNCSYQLSRTSQSFTAAGGAGSVIVGNATGNCLWDVQNVPNWVTLGATTPIVNGTTPVNGNAVVNFTVAANPSPQSRSETLRIAGQNFTINQDGVCTYAVSPTPANFAASGGTGVFSVITAPATGCPWQAILGNTWATITSGASGAGSGLISYTVSQNTSTASRSMSVTVANRTATINQQGTTCTYTPTLTSVAVGSAGGTVSFPFTASSTACPWALSSPLPSWMSLPANAATAGTGNATISVVVASNGTGVPRAGSIVVGTMVFTVNQLGAALGNLSVPGPFTPVNLSGSIQTFAVTFTDNDSNTQIASGQVLFSTASNNLVNECHVHFDKYGAALWLMNDQGTSWLGPQPIGVAGSLENAQCSIDGGTSTVALPNAFDVVLSLPVTFKPAFAGLKNIYGAAKDFQGATGSYELKGTWTVPGAVGPTAVSVSPSSGTGGGVTLTAVFSDANGASDMVLNEVFLGTGLGSAANCYVAVSLNNQVSVGTSAGTIGSGSTLTNGYCNMNPASASVSRSGTTTTLTLPLIFLPTLSGPINVYLKATDASTATSGWIQRGTFNVTTGPATVQVNPPNGTGLAQTFTFSFADPNGGADIKSAEVLISSSLTSLNSCYLYYDRLGNTVYVSNDAGDSFVAGVTLGGGSANNSFCKVLGTGSSTSISGNTLNLTLNLEFTGAFVGNKIVYLRAQELDGSGGRLTSWDQRGLYTVTYAPTATSVSGTAGSDGRVVFATKFNDPLALTKWVQMQLASGPTVGTLPYCYVHYDRLGNGLWLYKGPGPLDFLGPVTPGSPTTLGNSYCTIDAANSSVSTSGRDLIVNVSLTLARPAFSGTKTIFLRAADQIGSDTGFVLKNVWTVP